MNNRRDSILDTLGFDLESNNSKILKAILTAQEDLGAGITFEVLDSKLREILGGKKMSRPLIYRYLKTLEDSEVLLVNRDVNPNLYIVSFESVVQALEKKKAKKVGDIREEISEITNQESALTNVDLLWLARRLYVMLAGKPEKVGTKTVKGLVDAHYLIDSEVYSRAVEGDTIRVTLDWFQLSRMGEIERQAAALRLAERGGHIKTLQYFPEKVPREIIKLRYDRLKDLREEKGIDAGFRIASRQVRTYQGVALNRDGFVLVVSEEPLTVIWIPRSTNEALINEAINSFDRDFENGTDYLEYYGKDFHEHE